MNKEKDIRLSGRDMSKLSKNEKDFRTIALMYAYWYNVRYSFT